MRDNSTLGGGKRLSVTESPQAADDFAVVSLRCIIKNYGWLITTIIAGDLKAGNGTSYFDRQKIAGIAATKIRLRHDDPKGSFVFL